MRQLPTVSIIFPSYNADVLMLNGMLNSIRKQTYPKSRFEVLLIDNGSTKKPISHLQKMFPFLKIISLKSNLGFSKAVNIGLKKARGDYYFVTNNDVWLHPLCLKILVSYLKTHPKTGIVGPITYCDSNLDNIAFSALKYNLVTNNRQFTTQPFKTQETDFVPGHAMLFSKKLIEKIGLFDENFFFYFEDIDFCFRSKKAGFKVVYCPRALLWHKGSATSFQNSKSRLRSLYHHHKSRQLFLLKQGTSSQQILGFLYEFIKYLPYYLILRDGSLTSLIQATVSNLKIFRKKSTVNI